MSLYVYESTDYQVEEFRKDLPRLLEGELKYVLDENEFLGWEEIEDYLFANHFEDWLIEQEEGSEMNWTLEEDYAI